MLGVVKWGGEFGWFWEEVGNERCGRWPKVGGRQRWWKTQGRDRKVTRHWITRTAWRFVDERRDWNGREGRWREMVASGLFSQQKIETKCQGQSFEKGYRFRTRNHLQHQHTNSHNQPAERTTRSTRQQRKNTHSTKQSNHARQQQHSTARQPRHPAKKNQKRRKKSTVKSKICNFGGQSVLVNLRLYKDNSHRFS